MLIATWNVNGVRARLERLREWLAERGPDVALLQELKVEEAGFPHAELRAAGYHAVVVGQPAWNGVAVLAREPPECTSRALPGPSAGARFVSARACGVEVASVYVPNGKAVEHPEFPLKLAFLDRLAEAMEARDRAAPFVLAGDFNVCPTDLDSYLGERGRGSIFHTEPERARFERVVASGLVDLFRAKHPADPGHSFWDYRAGAFHRRLGMRLDFLLATPGVARRVADVFVDRDFRKKGKASGAAPSDHAPVVAALDGAGRAGGIVRKDEVMP